MPKVGPVYFREWLHFIHIVEMRPPTHKGLPLEVDFSMTVVDINSINVEDMDFR